MDACFKTHADRETFIHNWPKNELFSALNEIQAAMFGLYKYHYFQPETSRKTTC